MNELPPISPGTNSCRVPAQMWQGSGQWAPVPVKMGEPSPREIHQVPAQMGVARVSAIPVQMWQRCPSPGTNVVGVSAVPVPMRDGAYQRQGRRCAVAARVDSPFVCH